MADLGWTQKQLADALNCTQQHISVLLNGKVNMTLETLAKLEAALHFDLIGQSLQSFTYQPQEQSTLHNLNSPAPGEQRPDIDPSTLVDGYKPRREEKIVSVVVAVVDVQYDFINHRVG